MSNKNALIMCENVTMSYDGKVVLKDLSFHVQKGDYLCIVGENGSGKTTLMKGILGLHSPAAGKFSFGEELKQNQIGYLPQQTMIQKDFPASVWEVVMSGNLNSSGIKPFFSKAQRKKAEESMQRLSITDIRKKCYRELSGGQQQRVLLARALCATKEVLLLDEPVTGLDPIATAEFYTLIKKLNTEGITIIMISHDIVSAIDNANKMLHLGEQTFFGTTDEYKHSDIGSRFLYHNCHCDVCTRHQVRFHSDSKGGRDGV